MWKDDGRVFQRKKTVKKSLSRLRIWDDSRTRAWVVMVSVYQSCLNSFWFNGRTSVDESLPFGGARFIMTWPENQLASVLKTDTVQKVARKIHQAPRVISLLPVMLANLLRLG